MSYDLLLWREAPGAKVDPEQVLKEADDGVALPGVVPLPLRTVTDAFKTEFPDVSVADDSALDWESEDVYFQAGYIYSDEKHASVIEINCSFSLARDRSARERIRKVARALECRIYDPQQPAPKESVFKRWFGGGGS